MKIKRRTRVQSLLLALVLLLSFMTLMTACKPGASEETGDLIIDERYTVIYPAEYTKSVRDVAIDVKLKVKSVAKLDVEAADDSGDPGVYEVLVGKTNRSETAEAIEQLGDKDYIVAAIGRKLVIYAADDVDYKYAMNYFSKSCVVDKQIKAVPDMLYTGVTESPLVALEKTSDYCEINTTFTASNAGSEAGIFIGFGDTSAIYGYQGYCVVLTKESLMLYRMAAKMTEMASVKVAGLKKGKEASVRVTLADGVLSGYFLDDAEGVEPWPEFVMPVTVPAGAETGFVDLSGYNAESKSFTVKATEKEATGAVYNNTVLNNLADPDVLLYDGTYYLYGTGGSGYTVYSSTDLVNWKQRGIAASPNLWGETKNYWAPDIEYVNGKFYMVVSCNEKLGLAVSDSPLGPFKEHSTTILYEKSIDGHIFVDDDGEAYLYFVSWRSGYGIYGVKLDSNMLPIASTEKKVISVTEDWEKKQGNVTEGPFMLKHNGTYYLTYSGSHYKDPDYAVGYATSSSPLGTFKKYANNPIMIGNSLISGTGHHCITTTPDGSQLVIVYHCHNSVDTVQQRKICVDLIRFAPVNGSIDRLEVYGPTVTKQPVPVK